MGGKPWQYNIFVLIAVLIYQVKGQDVELNIFPKAGEAEHVELEAFPENKHEVIHEDLLSTSAPHESSTESSRIGIYRLQRPLMCYYSPDKGECVPKYPRFYYDTAIGNCRMFLWSGCGGNGNRFLTKTQCMRMCSAYLQNNQ